MLLDLKNNELVFSRVEDLKTFRNDLKNMKDVKAREYKAKFYISLGQIDAVRKGISEKYKGKISFSFSYQKFANLFILHKGPVEIKWGPVTSEIIGCNLPWEDIVNQTCYFDKKAMNAKQYGKSWSGYTHLFDPLTGSFPSGLLERITTILAKHQVPFNLEQTFSYPKPYFNLQPVFAFTPTQDQEDAVAALSAANNGIGKLPTGFGKTSFVAAALIAKKGVRSLFLANQRVLIDDAKQDFENTFKNDGIKIGMIGDGVFEPGDITVASIQSIASALKPPTEKELQLARFNLSMAQQRVELAKTDEELFDAKKDTQKAQRRIDSIVARREKHAAVIPFLKEVQLFIVDESQVLGTEQWDLFLHACPAPYRYTLSATDTRTDGGRIQIVAATGERRYESSAAEQIEKGRLSEFMGYFQKFDHKMDRDVIKDLDVSYHQAYEFFIVQNEKRNEHLCHQTIRWAKEYSVLALVTRKEHGEIVHDMLIKLGMDPEDVHFIHGETSKKERRDKIEAFRNGDFSVLIGTSIFDVGFNAKNAAKMVRFNAGGSEVREPQRAGRTVRLREDGSIGESYDILDINVPFFEAQGWRRVKLLKEEFGNDRVKIKGKPIDGELNVVGLNEIVASLPTETDRKKGEEIIKSLQFGEDDYDDIEGYDLEDLEPNLKNILTELSFD